MSGFLINPFQVQAGGGGGYTPPAIGANYLMWCEARHLSLSDNDPVSQFTNQVSSHHWTGSGSTRPLFKTNVLNSQPVLRFDGSDDFLILATDIMSGETEGEVFIVVKIDTDPPGASAQSGLWNMDGEGTNTVHYPFTNGQLYEAWGSNSRKSTGVDPTPALTSFRLYNVASKSADFKIRLDGTQIYTTGTNTFSNFGGNIYLGRSEGLFGDVYLDGDIAMIAIVDAVLNSTDRDAIEAEIASVYGLTIS